jgi:hypothetical protein
LISCGMLHAASQLGALGEASKTNHFVVDELRT